MLESVLNSSASTPHQDTVFLTDLLLKDLRVEMDRYVCLSFFFVFRERDNPSFILFASEAILYFALNSYQHGIHWKNKNPD